MSSGMVGHELAGKGATDVWLTPKPIIDALGPFDLDPCAATDRPWDTAADHYTIEDDGLSKQWEGLVWCNPPYSAVGLWLHRLSAHRDGGIALIFARTETRTFHEMVWQRADAVLFPRGRITFLHADGTKHRASGSGNAGAPSVFVAYGHRAMTRLLDAHSDGKIGGAMLRIPRGTYHDQLGLFSGWEEEVLE